MSSSRDIILNRVKDALRHLPARAAYPSFPDNAATMPALDASADPWVSFSQRAVLVNALPYINVAAVAEELAARNLFRGYCDGALWPQLARFFDGRFSVETEFDRMRVDHYEFGITQAVGAIAETGSVILNDATTSSRLGALAPWVHIAVLRRDQIHVDVAAAVRELGQDPNVVWITGPSKTADVEGILIQGVHGPGVQMIALLD